MEKEIDNASRYHYYIILHRRRDHYPAVFVFKYIFYKTQECELKCFFRHGFFPVLIQDLIIDYHISQFDRFAHGYIT